MRLRVQSNLPATEGFTIIELLMAIAIFLVAVGGVVTTVVTTTNLNKLNRQVGLATEGAQSALERLKSSDFEDMFSLYNADTADDPGGTSTAPGASFDIRGLSPQSGDSDGSVGEIIFPVSGGAVREDITDELLGMPRDLNMDLVVDAADHASDYQLMPVVIRVRWTGSAGDQEVELRCVLIDL